MLKQMMRRAVRSLGYDILKVPRPRPPSSEPAPRPADPIWPLPRMGMSDHQIREAFARFPHWHYAYEFEGGLSFPTAHIKPGPNTDDPARPLQRFRHFMPYLLEAAGGSLKGKRVLDVACNSGFWSIQCALLGADVIGFDARPELVAQANLIKAITGARSAEFRILDFWSMSPEELGGQFDIVLNLGLLYHLPEPLSALQLTKSMSRGNILVDTATYPADDFFIYLKWETPFDIRTAADEGIVALPTRRSMELMFRHVGFSRWREVPVRTTDIPEDYVTDRRISWLVQV